MSSLLMRKREWQRIVTIAFLIIALVGLTIVFQMVLEQSEFFSHFFYIPIVLSVIWWKKKGTLVAFFLAAVLLFSPALCHVPGNLSDNSIRASAIIAFGIFMSMVSDKIKRPVNERQETSESYKTLFETTETATILSGDDTTILMANTAAEKMFGYSRHEVEGTRSWCDFVHRSCREKLLKYHRLRRQDPDNTPNFYEAKITDKNGRDRNVIITAGIIPNTKKSIISLSDITRLLDVERLKEKIIRVLRLLSDCNSIALRGNNEVNLTREICKILVVAGDYADAWVILSTESKKKPFLTIGHDGSMDIDMQRKLSRQLITWPILQNTIISKRAHVAHDIDDEPDVHPLLKEEAQRIGYRSFVLLPLVNDRSTLGVLTVCSRKKNDFCQEELNLLGQLAENLSYRICVLRMREAQTAAVRTLTENESKLRSILKAVSDPMFMVSEKAEILWANDYAFKMFGAHILKQKCYDVCCKDPNAWKSCPVKKSFIDGDLHNGERRCFLPDEQGVDYWCTSSPLHVSEYGKIESVLFVLRDVTALKMLQRENIRNSHLASLGELAAGVAHEINNPINGIINYAQIIYDVNDGKNETKDISSRIITEGERVALIVKNLLSFSRSQEEEITESRLDQILIDTLTLIKAQLVKEGIHLSVTIPGELPVISARPRQLQQVFLNLIGNSRYALDSKFKLAAEGDKRLDINAQLIADGERQMVQITVYDNGAGIPEKVIDKVCNPFFSTKPVGQGTGLGLSISHGIVASHGGQLKFESQEGSYTKVILEFPV